MAGFEKVIGLILAEGTLKKSSQDIVVFIDDGELDLAEPTTRTGTPERDSDHGGDDNGKGQIDKVGPRIPSGPPKVFE